MHMDTYICIQIYVCIYTCIHTNTHTVKKEPIVLLVESLLKLFSKICVVLN